MAIGVNQFKQVTVRNVCVSSFIFIRIETCLSKLLISNNEYMFDKFTIVHANSKYSCTQITSFVHHFAESRPLQFRTNPFDQDSAFFEWVNNDLSLLVGVLACMKNTINKQIHIENSVNTSFLVDFLDGGKTVNVLKCLATECDTQKNPRSCRKHDRFGSAFICFCDW